MKNRVKSEAVHGRFTYLFRDCPRDSPTDTYFMEFFEQNRSDFFSEKPLSPGTSYLPFSGIVFRKGIKYWENYFEQNPDFCLKQQSYFCRKLLLTPAPFVSNKKRASPVQICIGEAPSLNYSSLMKSVQPSSRYASSKTSFGLHEI